MPASQQISAVIWGLSVGAAIILVIWATVRGGWFRKPLVGDPRMEDSMPEPVQPVHDYADGLSEAHGPVPLIVKIVIISFLVWAVVYVGLFARAGFTFS
jgi:hypothetical protein